MERPRAGGAVERPPESVAVLREQTVNMLLKDIVDDPLFWRSKQVVKDELVKPKYDELLLAASIPRILQASGLRNEIKSLAYEQIRRIRLQQRQGEHVSRPRYPPPPQPAPHSEASTLDIVEWARWRWADTMLLRLRDLSREQHQPFLRPRSPAAQGEGWSTDSQGKSTWDNNEVTTHHVVDLDGLYNILTSEMKSYSGADSKGALGGDLWWGALGVHFHAESLEAFRERHRDLAPERDHLGVLNPCQSAESELLERRQAEGQALLAQPYAPRLQEFARFGVPPGLRFELWSKCLPSEATRPKSTALQDVARGVCTSEWITDDVLRLDVAEHCANDVCFFPFDEIVESMILALSRDATVFDDCEPCPPQMPLLAGPEAGAKPSESKADTVVEASVDRGAGARLFVPPCGIVPFRGFSCYACPFAFFADKLEAAYPLFRSFFCRYLCRLHAVSCQSATLLPLCALFESLVFTSAPHVGFHLAQMGPEAAPLRIAFPWIVGGFVGFLRADQVLWLWDRIVGFDSVELVAVLAAAILAFRARLVLSATTPRDVEIIFSDLSGLQAMPLLQGFLFAGELGSSFDSFSN